MPRKRDQFLRIFNLSRHPSPAPSRSLSPVPQVISISSENQVKVAWGVVKTALILLKESSDWFPPLKSATGGLVAFIDAIELTSANALELEKLRQKIDGLTAIIKENNRDRTFPWLRRRLSEFAENLNKIVENVDEKSSHGKLRSFAEGRNDKEDITAFAGAISELVANLQTELTLYTSRGIKELLSNESLKTLKESEAAWYDALVSANEKQLVQRRGCTPNTRQKILADLMKWAKDPHSSRIYWMNGMAGTGKTTIAYSFCEQLQENGLLGSNFFCSRTLPECSDIRYIIPTVARQLVRSCPQFASALLEVLGADFKIPPPRNLLKRLISDPFQHISEPVTDTLIVVIDALDECSNRASEILLFLKQICNYFSTTTIPLKVFVTSRPEDVISGTITQFKSSSPSEWSVVHIHEFEKSLVEADIKIYVEDELGEVARIRRLEGWPPSIEVDAVVGNANRLFIYAATVIRYVQEDGGNPRRRLSELASTSPVGKGTSQHSSLSTEMIDDLYMTILKRAFHRKNEEETQVARMVLKLIVCAQTPLTLGGIADLLNALGEFKIELSTSDVRTAIILLSSVISTPMGDDAVATTFHASFPDFLFDSRRCGAINHIPFRQSHQDLARSCLLFMERWLTVDNITSSDRWQTIDAIIKQKKVERCISSTLSYACIYWASHIDSNDETKSLSMELDRFLTHQVLRWLEVLSLLRQLDVGVQVLQRLKECKHARLSFKFDDAYKFLKDISDIINVWPSEVFHSSLVWAPEQSFIWKTYRKGSRVRIVCGQRTSWGGACELTLRGHSDPVNSVAVSLNNLHVVSGSCDKTVRIWNALTGEKEHVLQGHSSWVNSVAVSPDNLHVVSGSYDNTVRIWNALTGEEEHVLLGHSSWVYSVAVSPDNLHVVSGSNDETVRIWNALTGEEEHVLRGHSTTVNSVAVSPDNLHVVSGSKDNTVRIWNALTGEEEHVLRGHSSWVNSVAVSPDNLHVVSGSNDKTVRIWNALTGEEEHVLQGHSNMVYSVSVSPDNLHVVSGSYDKTVRIWNALTGEEEHVLLGHSSWVNSVAVSPDNLHVVSGSEDETVRIWNALTGEEEHVLRGHSSWVSSVAVSPDNLHVVSGSMDKTIRIWNASTGEEEHVLQGHSNLVYSVAVSPDNLHVVSGSYDWTIRIWNALTGEEEHVLRGHSDVVNSVAVSPDNLHVVSGSNDETVRIWNALTGEEEHVLQGHSSMVYSVAVSPDSLHVVSGSADMTVRIWNALTGEEEHVLRGHSGSVDSVAVSPDHLHIVSGSNDNTVRIWSASTGEREPSFVISFIVSSDNCQVMTGPLVNAAPIGRLFLSSMATSIALLDNIMSVPVIRRLVSGESFDLGILLQAIWDEQSPVLPFSLSPDGLSILLSNGKKCLGIPSSQRDIRCAAFFGTKVCFGHDSGRLTFLDIESTGSN